jgi:hypothetical protein
MKTYFIRLITLAVVCGLFLAAQPADDAERKQVIIFGRHATFDCPLERFVRIASQVIDPQSVDLVN